MTFATNRLFAGTYYAGLMQRHRRIHKKGDADMLPNNRKPYSRTKKTSARSSAPSAEGTAAVSGARRKRKIPWYKKILRMMVPTKKDSTVDKIRKVIFDVAILVFIGSCTYLINYYGQSDHNAKFYDGVAGLLGNGEVSENYPRAYFDEVCFSVGNE